MADLVFGSGARAGLFAKQIKTPHGSPATLEGAKRVSVVGRGVVAKRAEFLRFWQKWSLAHPTATRRRPSGSETPMPQAGAEQEFL